MKSVILDTNILIDGIKLEQFDKVYIPIIVVEELDNLKRCKNDEDTWFRAKEAIKQVHRANNVEIMWSHSFSLPSELSDSNDNKIIAFARDCTTFDKDCIFLSNDYNVRLKAKHLNIPCDEYNNNYTQNEVYKGYKEIYLTDEEQAEHYQNPINKWNLIDNEYLIIKNKNDEIVDKQRWIDSKGFIPLNTKALKSIYFGDIKAKDIYQMLAIDSLYNSDFTLLFGIAGSAKTLLSLGWIMQSLQNGKIGKCVIIFNSVPLKNNQSQGFYPGSRTEKLLQSSLGGILSSKLGDITMVETLINQGKILLIPTCDIRGIEISDNDCLFVTEAQNIDTYTMRTILQRAKQGSKIIVEGDLLEQCDLRNTNKAENGMMRAIEVFKGTKYFSCVKLKNTYRSPISEIAQNI